LFNYEVVFVYRYEERGEAFFGVNTELMDYELASIDEIDRGSKWGNFIIVQEGMYVWNEEEMDYFRP
jgi:hypothetical protein